MKLDFGKHKGKDIEEVPDDYLLWILDNDIKKDKWHTDLWNYLEENEDAIRKNGEKLRKEYDEERFRDMGPGDMEY